MESLPINNGRRKSENNYTEATNQRLYLQMSTLTIIWTFISNFKNILSGCDTSYEHLGSRNSHPRKIKKFRDTNKLIKMLNDNYDSRNKILFLRDIAYNIFLKFYVHIFFSIIIYIYSNNYIFIL